MRVGLWGNFGALNLGNECVLAATVANFRARIPGVEISVICRDPQDVLKRYGIAGTAINQHTGSSSRRYPKLVRVMRLAWLESREWLRAFRFVGELDALQVTGCGILSDLNEGSLGLPYELLKWSLMARLRGVKLFYVSVGAETLSRPISRRMIRWALGLAEYRSYRDANSAALLAECGVDSKRDAVRPDLAFGLAVPPSTATGAVLARIAIGVIDFRGLAGQDDAESYQTYLNKLCELIAALLARGHSIRVIVGDFRYDDQVRADLRSELDRRKLLPADQRYEDHPAESFEVLLQQMQPVDFVIASRFHNVLLGLLMGKPAISLSYEAKHEALMKSMGLSEYCQAIATIDVQKLVAQFEQLQHNAPEARALIVEQATLNQASIAEQFDQLAARIRAERGVGR